MSDIKEVRPEWKNIEKGTVLMMLKMVIGNSTHTREKFQLPVWEKHIVESTTRVFYVVNGEKFRKENHGVQSWGKNFVFVGESYRGYVAPSEPTEQAVIDKFNEKRSLISKASIIYRKINDVDCMDVAAELSKKVLAVKADVDSVVDSQSE
ncbi:hypothetical protein VCHA53O466_50067 [Vibrio chagasii]|nr:hypothetical protein VCHA53O466_50067 [Vibrio chagasii]